MRVQIRGLDRFRASIPNFHNGLKSVLNRAIQRESDILKICILTGEDPDMIRKFMDKWVRSTTLHWHEAVQIVLMRSVKGLPMPWQIDGVAKNIERKALPRNSIVG